jgi:hypothetical protein
MKVVLLVLLLACSVLANNVVTFSCKQNQGTYTLLLNGGGFRNFITEDKGTCVDTKGSYSFICGASEFKCIGCLEKVTYEHKQGA